MRSSSFNRSFSTLFRIVLTAFLLAVPLFGISKEPLQPKPHYSQIARQLAYHLPREHLTHQPLNDTISSRTWTNYITLLDYSRVYFLQSDIETFKAQELTLDDTLKSGDVGFAYQVFAIFLERVRDRNAFAATLLKNGFDFTRDESYAWRRKGSIRAADRAAWDELWRKKMKNEYLRRLIARELAEEEKKKKEKEKPKKKTPGKRPNKKVLPRTSIFPSKSGSSNLTNNISSRLRTVTPGGCSKNIFPLSRVPMIRTQITCLRTMSKILRSK